MPSQPHRLGMVSDSTTLTLPSQYNPKDPDSPHNTCEVKKLTPHELMESGLLDHLDSLTALVGADLEKITTGTDPTPTAEALRVLSRNKEDITRALSLVDKIVEMALVDPVVFRPVVRDEHGRPVLDDAGNEIPLSRSDRDPNVIYTDVVSPEDKNHILAWVMGGIDRTKPFRKRSK